MEFIKKNFHYLLLLSSVFFLGNPSKFPSDDGFFYPQIAYNLVNHGFMGFNDLYLTNGFHPLWMVFCVVAELINPSDKFFALNILWLFQVLLVLFGYILLEKTVFKESKMGKILSLAFYCLMFFSLGTLYLIEAHLTFFTFSLIIFFMCKRFTNDFAFGLICSLVFLARLDHVFVLIPFGFLYWNFRKWSIKSLGLMIVGFLVLALPYLLSNYYLFDNFVPISGRIKSSFPDFQPDIHLEFFPKIFVGCGILYFIFLCFNKKDTYRAVKFSFLIGSLLQLIYNLLFQSEIGQWYFVSQMFFCGLFIYDVANSLFNKTFEKWSFDKIIFAGALIFVCGIAWLKLTTSFSIQNNVFASHSKLEKKSNDLVRQTAQEFEQEIPKKTRIYVYDFPGKFAFYSDFNVIPADGLVANKQYFNDMKSGNFKNFMIKNDIKYLLFPTHFHTKHETQGFLALHVDSRTDDYVFKLRNTLRKTIIDSLKESELTKIKSYVNPIKTWQPQYDSVSVYQLKN
ncbi:hypothetical protein [Chryseobacterium turcicum]|uniref:Glycosyltransferase RgtA/B/C/D-like domain-containing protein n=1 Tax=Chryseobacterium turcicum TaxID=2898076 RepID=A0A9Q3YZD1_9FLAO|nr:hypothetical protein [Chryseobacterium turcicum]MCD1118125.1 hypothetical protein [Chryseobacterium turcicum]